MHGSEGGEALGLPDPYQVPHSKEQPFSHVSSSRRMTGSIALNSMDAGLRRHDEINLVAQAQRR